ncbi:MAG: hypothetical protein HY905_20615 [Deltaproteobacteria bacterium]|nr:hypothetical protein [Deltaproteobacteria bacterium]
MTRPSRFTVALAVALIAVGALGLAITSARSPRKPENPAVLGAEVGRLYDRMIRETAQAVSQATSPIAIRPRIDAIRARYGNLFAKLGAERNAMGPNDRDTVSNVAYTTMQQAPERQLLAIERYAAGQRASDPGLAKELDDMLRLEAVATVDRPVAAAPRT